MRLLLIDQDDEVELLAKKLRQETYAVDTATDCQAAAEKALSCEYDAILLSSVLSGGDGLELCSELRTSGLQSPLLILGSEGSVDARIRSLDAGADAFVARPFELREVLAYLRALMRRRPAFQDSMLKVDNLEIDTRSKTVYRGGVPVRLTAKEYALLECLARDAGTLLSRKAIASRVWDDSYDPFSNLIEEYIKRIRKKVDLPGESSLIHSRRGEGYILCAQKAATAESA